MKNYPTTAVTTKYLENHVSDIRHKAFESTPGDISNRSDYSKQFIFEPDNQLQNEFFDNNRTLSMEGCCLYCFRKTVNVSIFYDNGGGYVHQYIDTVQEFHLSISDSKLKHSAMTTAHLYTLLARMFEKKTNDKRWNNVVSNRWMRKEVYVFHCLLSDVFSVKTISNCS